MIGCQPCGRVLVRMMDPSKRTVITRPPGLTDFNGKPLCCWCGGGPLTGRRTRWCSKDCVNEFWIIKGDAGVIRSLLLKRDGGICACCGVNAERLRNRIFRMWMKRRVSTSCWLQVQSWMRANGWPDIDRSWWEADHIIEVVRGGGRLGLENFQILCVRCHKAKTARLARERAAERRPKNPTPEFVNLCTL